MEAMPNRVIVDLIPDEGPSDLIVIPDETRKLPTRGVVRAVGVCYTHHKRIPIEPGFGPGDTVWFPARAVSYLDGDQAVGVLLAQDVMAVEVD